MNPLTVHLVADLLRDAEQARRAHLAHPMPDCPTPLVIVQLPIAGTPYPTC